MKKQRTSEEQKEFDERIKNMPKEQKDGLVLALLTKGFLKKKQEDEEKENGKEADSPANDGVQHIEGQVQETPAEHKKMPTPEQVKALNIIDKELDKARKWKDNGKKESSKKEGEISKD